MQDLFKELAESGPGRPRFEVRRMKNARRFVLYEDARRRGKSFSYRALQARLRRRGSRTLRDGGSDLFDAYFRASIEFDPAGGKRPRGLKSGSTAFVRQIQYIAPWAYLWAQSGGKGGLAPSSRWAVDELERREDWESLTILDKNSLIAAALVLRRHGKEWERYRLMNPLEPDDKLNRPESFYRTYVLPRLAETRRA